MGRSMWMNVPWCPLLLLLLFCMFGMTLVHASVGDRNHVFKNVLRSCLNINCSTPQKEAEFTHRQPLARRLLGWDCIHECRYEAMWITVTHLVQEGNPVLQFYGKWPFIRILGIQEPASVIFSIGNGFSQVYFLRQVRQRVPDTVPMYYVGHVQATVAINAWIWSVVFHCRDLPWTEMLDYFCAYSIVMCGLWTALIRVFAVSVYGVSRRLVVAISVVLTAFFLRHIFYLRFIDFDYGYNMKVNVTTGVISFILWVVWGLWNMKRQPYLWKVVAAVVAVNLCLMLELLDFPPILWTFDAHSLWHAGTIPVAVLWTSFFVDDCLHLHNSAQSLKKGV